MTEVVLDLFGGDNPAETLVPGIIEPLQKYSDLHIVLTGNAELLENAIVNMGELKKRIKIVSAENVLTNYDDPMNSVHGNHGYSITAAFDYYRASDDAVGLISVGNTGAVIISALVKLGLKSDVTKPVLASVLPTDCDRMVCIADCGANPDASAEDLVNFARLGSDYMKSHYHITEPTVALLSLGKESTKGNKVCKQAYKLLEDSGMNFVGNIEPEDCFIPAGDVVVCDGFTGNILLKNTESTGKRAIAMLEKACKSYSESPNDIVEKASSEVLRSFAFNDYGGAIIMGTVKSVIKAHGQANSDTIKNCIFQALAK